ncbi:MAG: hypothetical protein ACI9SQ_001782 [Rubritalea sp.]|jgi:hypothetical protein
MKLDFTKTVLLLALSFYVKITACPEEYNPIVQNWITIKKPDLNLANYSNHHWCVKKSGEIVSAQLCSGENQPTLFPKFDTKIQLNSRGRIATPSLTHKAKEGWIIAYDEGEFGAAVYWFNDDGTKKQKISDLHINGFQIEGKRILAITGLAHMGSTRGSLVEFKLNDKGWKLTELIKFPASAEAIARVKKDDYIIITTYSLLRINPKNQVKTLIKTDWCGLYPTSLIVNKDTVYVGMRQFVARYKLTPKNQQIDWLIPAKKWLNTNSDPFQ